MLLFLLHDNSILSRAFNQHPVIAFCMYCSLRYRLFWNPCFSFDILYFCLSGWWIVVSGAGISAGCLDYTICKTKHCWRCVDAHFYNRLTQISCTVLPEKAAITSYMNYCHKAILRLPKMQDQESLTLHWRSFSGWGREHIACVLALKGG